MFNRNMEFLGNLALKSRLTGISIEDSKADMSYCMTTSNDYLLMKNDIPIDDIDNPRQAIRKMLADSIKSEMGANDIIITFGIGLCYLLDEVYDKYPSKIYVYEPDIKLLHFVLNNVDISEHLASGRVFVSDKLDEIMQKLSETFISNDKVEIVYLKNYALIKSQELIELTQKVYETCRTKLVDINTIKKYSKTWLMNTLKNISYINNSTAYKLSDLKNKFNGQTALILAAGPSLMENIEKIKANRNKYVVFAVNKALRTLDANGITPDFVVCLDAKAINSSFVGLDDFCRKTNCITDLYSDSAVFSKNFKRVFVSFSKNDFVVKKLSEYNKIHSYENGGTATAMAFVAAVKMGFDKIIFSGLDLAFKNETMYATGESVNKISDTQIKVSNTIKNLTKIKSVMGDFVLTREDYAAFVQHFEILIKELKVTSEIYNTTSFGAAINGIKNVKFEDIHLSGISTGIPFILGELTPFKLNLEEWTKEELKMINEIISLISKNVSPTVLISAIVKSPLMYQYMQADILEILQNKMRIDNPDELIQKTKIAIKDIINNLQNYKLI